MEKIKVVIDYTNKNYSATTTQVGGVVLVTEKKLDALKEKFADTFAFHIEGCIADGDILPGWAISGQYEFEYKFTTSALLQRFDGVLTRSALSRITGINERQLGHYATGYRKPRKEQRNKIISAFHQLGRDFIKV